MRTVSCPIKDFQELVGELLARGERATFRVTGHSMHPTIADGDVITVRGATADELRIGDIVAFRRGEMLVVHRVIEVSTSEGARSEFRTAGDGNLMEDGIQPGDALLGRVTLVKGHRGEWNPQRPVARLAGRWRVILAKHPRTRSALRIFKRACRSLGILRKREVPA